MGLRVTRRGNTGDGSLNMEAKEEPTAVGPSTRAKRSRELQSLDASSFDTTTAEPTAAAKRTRAVVALAAPDDRKKERWQAHQLADDYIELASKIALQSMGQLGPYGFDPANGSYPLEAVSVLRFLKSPMRRTSVLERWAPLEIALFEAALAEHGKEFHKVQKEIKTKTTREVIDFYYIWKKTAHYKRWKKQYVPPYLDMSDDDNDDERKPPAQ